MRYHNITKDDMLNGDGLRVVLWTAGCSHHCKNCQNPITWDANGGIEFDAVAREELMSDLQQDYINGITFSGGDPLHDANVKEICSLIFSVKFDFPQKTIWIYSGYTWEEIINGKDDGFDVYRKYAISLSDVFVDGEYIEKLKNKSLKWRGSSNQRVIDIQQTLHDDKIVLFCD